MNKEANSEDVNEASNRFRGVLFGAAVVVMLVAIAMLIAWAGGIGNRQ